MTDAERETIKALNAIHESLEKANYLKEQELKLMTDRNYLLKTMANA